MEKKSSNIKIEYEISGVERSDYVQNDFLSVLHGGTKMSHNIKVKEQRLEIEGKIVLAFYIYGNSHTEKPVYLNGDIRKTFIRRGGCNQQASKSDIERLLRDANVDRWDGQVCEFDLNVAFDPDSVNWYRNRFYQANRVHNEKKSDIEFLYHWGYLSKDGGQLKPTRAAILLFGSSTAVHHILPRPTLDVQWMYTRVEEPMPKVPWFDRLVLEDNIIITWQKLLEKYLFYGPRPFLGIDPHTLAREDTPPGYRVFREAVINLLMHQDYEDHSRKAVIKFFRDGVQFWNPGDVFGDDQNLMEPGEKEVRNPKIVAAFRRIVLCEQAGTGLRMMKTLWQEQGNPEPVYTNDRSRKAFEFFLPQQIGAFQNVELPKIVSSPVRPHSVHGLAQADTKALSECQIEVLQKCYEESSLVELMNVVGRSDRFKFKKQVLNPLIEMNLIEMKIPDKPRSSKQKYKLTFMGHTLVRNFTANYS